MKTFDVYKHPAFGYQAVKQGFGWPAFTFTWMWAFVKKMWGIGFAIIAGLILLFIAGIIAELKGDLEVSANINIIGPICLSILVGLESNNWRRRNLIKRGFEKLDTIEAKNIDAAITSVAKSSTEG